jgi:DNA-binding GntR family transcriptional regulator
MQIHEYLLYCNMARLRSARRPLVVDQVLIQLREALVSQRYRPGQRLSLRELGAACGVSLIPVREALRSLEAEGLVELHARRSATVSPLTVCEVDAIFRLRGWIEPPLAEQAMALHDSASLNAIERSLARCRGFARVPGWHRQLHDDIHLSFFRPAMSGWDHRALDPLVRAASRYLSGAERTGISIPQPRCTDYADYHQNLIRAFRSHDRDNAVATINRYLEADRDIALITARIEESRTEQLVRPAGRTSEVDCPARVVTPAGTCGESLPKPPGKLRE